MAITLTKKYTLTYTNPRPEPGDPDSPYEMVTPYIADQVALGKTDGKIEVLDLYTSVRLWADQTSAQEFANFLEAAVVSLGRNDSSYTITDI
jgi:hypothetical protein